MGMNGEMVMRVLDKGLVRRYVESGGCKCLFCGSGSIEGEGVNVDSGGASQMVRCSDCGGEWTDIHSLVGVVAMDRVMAVGVAEKNE